MGYKTTIGIGTNKINIEALPTSELIYLNQNREHVLLPVDIIDELIFALTEAKAVVVNTPTQQEGVVEQLQLFDPDNY